MRVAGAELAFTAPKELNDLPEVSALLLAHFAFPSAPEAPGRIALKSGAGGVDLVVSAKASPSFAGESWAGDFVYSRGAFEGEIAPQGELGGGLSRAAAPPMRAVVESYGGAKPHLNMRAFGVVVQPPASDEQTPSFFNTPYVLAGGGVGAGWNHSPADADFIGYPSYDEAEPLEVRGHLHLSDKGADSVLDAQVAMTYTDGRKSLAHLDGLWTYFDRPGRIFGHGEARISSKGVLRGRVNLQLDIDTPGGELVHAITPADFVSSPTTLILTTPRFDGLMQQAAIRSSSHIKAEIHVEDKSAEVTMDGSMSTRGTWEWPDDDTLGVLQVDLRTQATLGIAFESVAARGKFRIEPTKTAWSGVISGPLNLGFTTSLLEGTSALGSGVSCFPKLCNKAELKVPTEHLGFHFDLGPGWLELGECSRTCSL